MLEFRKGHLAEVEDGFYDFSGFAFKTVPLKLTYGKWWQMHFGFYIDSFATHTHRLFADTNLQTSDDGKTFTQEFQGNASVIVACDLAVPGDVIDVDDVERGPKTTVWLRLKCPERQSFYRWMKCSMTFIIPVKPPDRPMSGRSGQGISTLIA
jgi:hypothetical protein